MLIGFLYRLEVKSAAF